MQHRQRRGRRIHLDRSALMFRNSVYGRICTKTEESGTRWRDSAKADAGLFFSSDMFCGKSQQEY